MRNQDIFTVAVAGYVIISALLLFVGWLSRRRPIARTPQEGTARRTGPLTVVTEIRPPHRCSPVDVDSPPVALKLPPARPDGDMPVVCKRVLFITGCSDSSMWYAKLVGREVPYLGEWKADGCYKSREPAGYVNIVKFADARIIVKEVR